MLELDLVHTLTTQMRSSDGRDFAALRRELRSAGFDPDEVALADFHPEGDTRDGGVVFEWMWVTMVSSTGAAYLVDLLVNEDSARLRRLREVPSSPIPEQRALAEQLSQNRRMKQPWNTDLPAWVTSTDDFLYNREIQLGAAYLAQERGGHQQPSTDRLK